MTEHESSLRRRAQIVGAMIETMAEHGYAKATIARVAEAADLTPGLLHYHFENKQQILLGVLDRLVGEQLLFVDELIEIHEGDPAAALDAVLVALLAPGEDARPDAVAAWVGVLAEAVRQPEVAESLSEALLAFRGLIAGVLEDGVQHGVFDLYPATPTSAAAGLVALIQGYFTVGVTARVVIPPTSALEVARRMVAGLTRSG